MAKERLFRAYRPGDRKRYFRENGALRCGPGLAVIPWPTRRETAIDRLRELFSRGGLATDDWQVVKKGKHTWVIYPLAMDEAVTNRLRVMDVEQTAEVCHTTTGAKCWGKGWARVLVQGIPMTLCAQGHPWDPLPRMAEKKLYEGNQCAPGEVRSVAVAGEFAEPGGIGDGTPG